MDSDEEYSDFETEEWDDLDSSGVSVTNTPSFETLTAEDIVHLMNQYIEQVNAIVMLPITTIRILLTSLKWEKQDLLDKLTAENRDEFFEKAHVLNPFAENNQSQQKPADESHQCNICFMEVSQDQIIGLGCGHTSCEDCWRQYLTYKIDDGNADSIRCPDTKCGIVVDDVTVMQVLCDEKAKQKYQYLITNSFVEHNRSLRWCPAPGCALAIKVNQLLAHQKNCTCTCGHSFCFQCGEASHDPIPCALIENWKKNSNDLNIEYFTKYTKECPKCFATIEKNGGCNRMICKKCEHPFCWLCYGPMITYDHQCNTFKDEEETDRSNRNRWQHYFKRYSLHKISLKCEENLKDGPIKSKMEDMQAMGKTWNEVQFLKKAVEILCESRKQLMFTYIFAYYIKDHNQKVIFESNQSDLETATEALSQYLEQNITQDNLQEITINVMDKSNYCERRQKTMQGHIYDGFENDWWSFATNLWSRLKQMM